MMFNQPNGNMQTSMQQVGQNQAMQNFQNGYNQPYPPQYYQYTPNWNRPVMAPTSQTPVQNQQINGMLSGKIITNLQEVRPNEVPMDGSAGIFPMNDFSSIYVKAWGQDGNIQTIKFIPDVTANKAVDQEPSEFDKIMERLQAIENLLNKVPETIPTEPQPAPVKRQSYQRKEVNNNAE